MFVLSVTMLVVVLAVGIPLLVMSILGYQGIKDTQYDIESYPWCKGYYEAIGGGEPRLIDEPGRYANLYMDGYRAASESPRGSTPERCS